MKQLNPICELDSKPKRLALKLSNSGEKHVLSGHPWLFSNRIDKINKEGNPGDIAIIFSQKNNSVIGVGLYDPKSPIRVKLLHHGNSATIDATFYKSKVDEAYKKRLQLLETDTNSYRLIFGENDNFPGLIADVYDTVLVIKLYSEIWLPYFEIITQSLIEVSECKTVVLRLSRNLQRSRQLIVNDGFVVYGELHNEVVPFKEHGIRFSANVIKGHKTGYFLDHRENRRRVGLLSKDKSVLDVFSYAGGFSVHALANGALEVTSLDISAQALEVAKSNGKLNEFNGIHKTIVGDAFDAMKTMVKRGKTYDIVVIDPPSFAKQQSETTLAKKKYSQLAELGAKLVAKHGILVLASCSSRVSSRAFFDINLGVLKRQDRLFRVIDTTYHDIDHPVTFPEGAYLKCAYYQFES
ncbi:class I SAM-dependent rRNA methyltransferase [Ichthyenterobacterium sp. W332]|uniref:Class I SAM-dependent rRNA methyltransferase n=1 Tax=Microcosmobacter mediterraneus TaxID=3075607 RepID=A0ABU2YKE6_9FLAO|nr:class I SAM-dependent rRNA methyltransferase [Ichthyenterobacterium sp. W332]MDT0558634.1 class I SAM-dependent rRNA methyltransferase [Ichthyenterobacterium sp. W332]